MKKQKHVFHVIVERDEEGFFAAECPALRSCYSQGWTYDEAIANIKDAIELRLQERKSPVGEFSSAGQMYGTRPVEVSV